MSDLPIWLKLALGFIALFVLLFWAFWSLGRFLNWLRWNWRGK